MVQTYNPLLKKKTKKELEAEKAIVEAGEKAKKEKETPKIEIPKPQPVPLPSAFATESRDVLAARQGAEGAVYLEKLKPSQAEGIKAAGGLTKEQQAIEAQNIRLEQVKNILGQVGQITPEERARVLMENPPQTLKGSIGGAIPDILAQGATYGAAGAAAGMFGGPAAPITIPVAAAAGFTIGTIRGILTEVKEEEQQGVSVQYQEFISARKDLTSIINDVNAGGDPIQAQALFNYVLAKIDRTERNLKMLEERDWLSKARRRLTAVQAFNDGERQALITKFQISLLKPNPNALINLPSETAEEIL